MAALQTADSDVEEYEPEMDSDVEMDTEEEYAAKLAAAQQAQAVRRRRQTATNGGAGPSGGEQSLSLLACCMPFAVRHNCPALVSSPLPAYKTALHGERSALHGANAASTLHAAAAAAFFDGLDDDEGPRIRGNRTSGDAAAASQHLQNLNAFSEFPAAISCCHRAVIHWRLCGNAIALMNIWIVTLYEPQGSYCQ